eukprot:Clim_evm33s227 gene=Clim_evmTU33s227
MTSLLSRVSCAALRTASGNLSMLTVSQRKFVINHALNQTRMYSRALTYRVPLTPTNPGVYYSRRTFMNRGRSRLERLEAETRSQPTNPVKEAELMAELNREGAPGTAVKRFESGRFPVNDAVLKEYVKALVSTGRIEKANMSKLLREAYGTNGQGLRQGMSAQAAGNTFAHGGEDRPVHVVMQEPGLRAQLWRTARMLVVAFLLISALNTVMEDRGFAKGMSIHAEIAPETTPQNFKFDDVRGADEAKDELVEIVQFLKDPERFTRLGGKLPKGVLLMGPPGTGKTMLARAVAGEAGVPFFYCSGSEFDEMFVGVGARRVRELFAAAKRRAPCIIFIDEIDAIGATRNPKDQQYVKMTLNQLLVELDGFSQTEGIIVIGATNFPDLLDRALVRPGRFDRHVNVPIPDVKGRKDILDVHMRNVPKGTDVSLSVLARGTPGFSGAELANVVNQAALKASMEGKEFVSMADLEYAKDKIIMGAERKSAVIDPENRRRVAYHEGGHAIMALYTQGSMPIHKATIMPRGRALGMVSQLPEGDGLSWSRQQLIARLDVCMGGRVAEELIFGHNEVTSGASSDLEQATAIARAMVMQYGLSEKVGPIAYKEEDMSKISTETRLLIEVEIKELLDQAYNRAKTLLNAKEQELHRLAEALLDNESLTAEEIQKVVKGHVLDKIAGA